MVPPKSRLVINFLDCSRFKMLVLCVTLLHFSSLENELVCKLEMKLFYWDFASAEVSMDVQVYSHARVQALISLHVHTSASLQLWHSSKESMGSDCSPLANFSKLARAWEPFTQSWYFLCRH